VIGLRRWRWLDCFKFQRAAATVRSGIPASRRARPREGCPVAGEDRSGRASRTGTVPSCRRGPKVLTRTTAWTLPRSCGETEHGEVMTTPLFCVHSRRRFNAARHSEARVKGRRSVGRRLVGCLFRALRPREGVGRGKGSYALRCLLLLHRTGTYAPRPLLVRGTGQRAGGTPHPPRSRDKVQATDPRTNFWRDGNHRCGVVVTVDVRQVRKVEERKAEVASSLVLLAIPRDV
jgi:hypothetical protein